MHLYNIKKHGIKRVLKVNGLSIGTQNLENHGVRVKIIDLDDDPSEKLGHLFEEAHDFIKEGIIRKEGVLVVCTAGISRSASIVMSYLMKEEGLGVDAAYNKVKQAREFVKPNEGFWNQLEQYGSIL